MLGSLRWPILIGVITALSACGGDGKSPSPPGQGPAPTPAPTSANQPPAFTSAATASVAENSPASTLLLQATATDPEGAPVNFAISGGADQDDFELTSAGALRFRNTPDHDLATDSDQDNLYEVQIAASDGSLDARQTIRVTVTNDREGLGLGLFCSFRGCSGAPQAVAAFYIPSAAGNIPGLAVASKDGTITKIFEFDDFGPSVFLNPSRDGERGIIHMVADPAFTSNGNFYVMYTDASGDIVIERLNRTFLESSGQTSGRGPILLRIPHAQHNNNMGGWMGFAPDGSMYVATGDGGGSGDPLNTAQDPSSRLGKVLRLGANFSTVEVVALGFRNPNGGSFHNGNLILADRGESQREELNIIPLAGPVRNYGWPFKEGTLTVRQGGPAGMIDPLAECPHQSGSRGCYRIVGGRVYSGNRAALQGQYIFGDRNYVDLNGDSNRGGFIFTIPISSLVFGRPTIQSSQFSSRTLDLFTGFPGVSDLTSFYQFGSRLYITQFQSFQSYIEG